MRKTILLFLVFIVGRSLGQSNCDSLFAVGDKLYLEGKYKDAVAAFNRIIDQDCKDLPRAYNGRGTVYNSLQQYDSALKDFESALKIDSNNSTAMANEAITYSDLKKYPEAIELLTKAIKISPKYYLFFRMRGEAEEGNEQNDMAIVDYENSMNMNKEDIDSYRELAKLYQKEKDYSDAEDVLNKLLMHHPNEPRLVIFRATFYRQTEQYDKAISDYATVCGIDSTDPATLYSYGYCYEMKGEPEQAIELYSKSILHKGGEYAYWGRGFLYKQLGQFALAIDDMQNYLKLKPNDAHAYLIIGNSYSGLGDKVKATEAYNKGLTLNPQYNIKALLETGLKNLKE